MTTDDPDATFARLGAELTDRLVAAVGPWLQAATAACGADLGADELSAATDRVTTDLRRRLDALLAADLETQRASPLDLARRALVPEATRLLVGAGAPTPSRDAHAVRLQPDDHFDLTPGSWSDLGPEVHEAGMAWGAAKAFVHLRRRRADTGPDGEPRP